MIKAAVTDSRDHEEEFRKIVPWRDYKAAVRILLELLVAVGAFVTAVLIGFTDWSRQDKMIGCAIFGLMGVWEICISIKQSKRLLEEAMRRSGSRTESLLYTCTFHEDSFLTEGGYEDTEWERRCCSYDILHSVVENDGYFLLFVDPKEAYVIGKSEITEGTPADLSALLQDKVGAKYRRAEG